MKDQIERLSALGIIVFLTLFYYALYGWAVRLEDARIVAAVEPNRVLLGIELALFGVIPLWGLLTNKGTN